MYTVYRKKIINNKEVQKAMFQKEEFHDAVRCFEKLRKADSSLYSFALENYSDKITIFDGDYSERSYYYTINDVTVLGYIEGFTDIVKRCFEL